MNSLLATFVICMGMSNGMPISDYNKKQINHANQTEIQPKYVNSNETQINEYTLTATIGTTSSTNYNNDQIGIKANISNYNSYINLIGNLYIQTQTIQENNQNYVKIANYNYYYNNENDVNDEYSQYMNKFGYMLKLTPYNYNINTSIDITISYEFGGSVGTRNIYSRYRVYQTTKTWDNSGLTPNWDNYIDAQIIRSQVTTYENDIRDPNNNFYYNYNVETDLIGNGSVSSYITKTFTIELQPNVDNYIFITVNPMIQWYETDMENMEMQPIEYERTNGISAMWWDRAPIIQGTNIIPPSSYEVIDLPGLMFEVLGMPFAFISQAFGLTLFPGTPYQVNISNLFLAIIATLVFVFLIKIIVKVSSKG